MTLRYTLVALHRIERALAHVEIHAPRGAVNTRRRVAAVTGLLTDHPYAGQATSRPDVRRIVLSPYPYVLFYRIVDGTVVVTRFRHAARRP